MGGVSVHTSRYPVSAFSAELTQHVVTTTAFIATVLNQINWD